MSAAGLVGPDGEPLGTPPPEIVAQYCLRQYLTTMGVSENIRFAVVSAVDLENVGRCLVVDPLCRPVPAQEDFLIEYYESMLAQLKTTQQAAREGGNGNGS